MRGRGKKLAKDKIERSSALAQRQMLLFDEVGGEQSTVAWPSDAVRRLFKYSAHGSQTHDTVGMQTLGSCNPP
jgi:hypothetical protein